MSVVDAAVVVVVVVGGGGGGCDGDGDGAVDERDLEGGGEEEHSPWDGAEAVVGALGSGEV